VDWLYGALSGFQLREDRESRELKSSDAKYLAASEQPSKWP